MSDENQKNGAPDTILERGIGVLLDGVRLEVAMTPRPTPPDDSTDPRAMLEYMNQLVADEQRRDAADAAPTARELALFSELTKRPASELRDRLAQLSPASAARVMGLLVAWAKSEQ